jgi:HEAT repeat protein
VPVLVEALSNPVENVRLGVKTVLIEIGEPAIPYLMGALSEEDEALNLMVMDILAANGTEAVPALITTLNHSDKKVQNQGFEALVQIGEPAVPSLVASLAEEEQRENVSEVLMAIGEPCIGPLIEALDVLELNEPAGDLIIEMGADAVDPLVQAYEDDPTDYRQLLRPLSYGLKLPNAKAREKVKEAVVSIGAPAVPQLLTLVLDANQILHNSEVIYANPVMEGPAGGAQGKLVNGGLCDSAGNWDDKIVLCKRGEIFFYEKILNVQDGGGIGVILYNNVPGDMLPTIIGYEDDVKIPSVALSDEEGKALAKDAVNDEVYIRSEDTSFILNTVIEIGEPAIVDLIDSLKQDTLYYFSEEALIGIGGPALDQLVDALADEDPAFRARVVYTLGRIGGITAEKSIIEMLRDPSEAVRWEAAYALGEMKSEEAIDRLVDLLEDQDEWVLWAAHDALVKIGLPAVELLMAYYHDEDSSQAEAALREIYEANARPVLEAAIGVCSGEAFEGAAEYKRYESDIYPMIIVTSYDEISHMTDDLPVEWLAFTPEELELVVCLGGQEKEVVQVCRYYYTGTGAAAPSTTRYRYKEEVVLLAAQTGVQIGTRTFRGSNPDNCPYQKSGTLAEITGNYIPSSEIADWLATFGIPFLD